MPSFTNRQRSIIDGCLLGDGCIDKPRPRKIGGNCGQSRFSESHKAAVLPYMEWLYEELKPFSCNIRFRKRRARIKVAGKMIDDPSGRMLESYDYTTVSLSCFTELRQLWYPSGIKIVPDSLELNPLVVAVWAAGDGSNDPKHGRFVFCTNGFSLRCRSLLKMKLKAMGFDFNLTGKTLVTATRNYVDFLDFLRPYVAWDCFKYKVSLSGWVKPKMQMNRLSDETLKGILSMKINGQRQIEAVNRFGISDGVVSNVWRLKHAKYRKAYEELQNNEESLA